MGGSDFMDPITDVRDVTGTREYKTPSGVHISPVFYAAVREYHDVLASGDYETMVNYVVSKEAALAVRKCVLLLAKQLKGGQKVYSLDVLPVALYDMFSYDERRMILEEVPPALGSKAREDYDKALYSLRVNITGKLSNAYGLPNKLRKYEMVTDKLAFSGVPNVRKAKKKLDVMRVLDIQAKTASSTFVATAPFSVAFPGVAGTLATIAGGVTLVAGFATVAATAEGAKVLNKKGSVRWVLGAYKKNFVKAEKQYSELVKPYLASMEAYLLQENSLVDKIMVVEEERTVTTFRLPGKPSRKVFRGAWD